MRLFFYLSLLVLLNSCTTSVDLLVKNATIYTMDSSGSKAEVMVIHEGKIVAIGSNDLLSKYHAKETIDANGLFIYPGFQDAHCHFSGYALDKGKLDLSSCRSLDNILDSCIAFHRRHPSSWLQGRQWDEHHFDTIRTPDKTQLDEAFPNTAVFLLRVDGHAALCNQKALDIAGIKDTSTFQGGRVGLTRGKLNGMVYDAAMHKVVACLPKVSASLVIPYFQETEQEFFAQGVTSFTDCMVEHDWMQFLLEAYDKKKLRIRGSYVLTHSAENKKTYLHQKIKNRVYQVCGFKIFADGSLGSRGACLFEPYSDQPHHVGYQNITPDSLKALAKELLSTHYQLVVHAIGDKTNHDVLQVMNDVLPASNDKRWRIEHAQVVRSSDLPLFGSKQIIPSVQPTHAISDMAWVEQRLGKERTKEAYAYKDLLHQLHWLPLGTDFPVEGLNPLHTFYAAVARKNEASLPSAGFQIENALSREEALRGITIWPARAVFREKETGSLEVGKEADFVLLPVDLLQDDLKVIRETKVLATYLAGLKVFEKH